MIGLLGALPVCPMALLVFIDFFAELQALVRSARRYIERAAKTVVRALVLATTPRPNLQKLSPSAGARF